MWKNLRDFSEYKAYVLINLQLKRIYPEEVFHIDILKHTNVSCEYCICFSPEETFHCFLPILFGRAAEAVNGGGCARSGEGRTECSTIDPETVSFLQSATKTAFAYLQQETAFVCLFCVVTRRAA
jgi:hypothetical protein